MPREVAIRPEVRSLSAAPPNFTGWVQGVSGLVHYVLDGVVYLTVHNEAALAFCHEALEAKNLQSSGF